MASTPEEMVPGRIRKRDRFRRLAFWKPEVPIPPPRRPSIKLASGSKAGLVFESNRVDSLKTVVDESKVLTEVISEVMPAQTFSAPPEYAETEIGSPSSRAPKSPLRTDTAASQGGKRAKIDAAIGRLNRAIIRLYKTSAILRGGLKPEDWSNAVNLDFLKARNLDDEIQRVASLTQQLILEQNRVSTEQASRKGLLAGTERFISATGRIIAPAVKNILKVAVEASAVSSIPSLSNQ